MPGPSDPFARPEAWWGVITASANAHESTAELWDRIHSYSQERGLAEPPNLFSEINRLRATASSLSYSSERLTSASPSEPLTSRYIAPQVYARSSVEQALAPLYHVRFEMTAVTGGQEGTGTYTLEWPGSLPDTVGELADIVESYATDLADAYGSAFSALGRIEIGQW